MKQLISMLLALCLAGCTAYAPAPEVQEPETLPAAAKQEPVDEEAQWVEDTLHSMTLEEKVGQMFFVALRDDVFTDAGTPQPVTDPVSSKSPAADVIARYHVGGVALFSENIVDDKQVLALNTSLQAVSDVPLLIGVDEEGGRVSRLKNLYDTPIPPAAQLAAEGAQAVLDAADTIGKKLAGLGFTLNFAPSADLLTNPENQVIGDRAFSSDPTVAGTMVQVFVGQMHQNGIAACIKHFPGHGDTTADTHDGAAAVTHSLDRMHEVELAPFLAGISADADFVMAAHIKAPHAAGDLPASMNPQLLQDELRGNLAFPGVIITDAMNMGAIANEYTSGQAAVNAVAAGVDMVLMPASLDEAYNAVWTAVQDGTLTEARVDESVRRILRVKFRYCR